MANKSLTDLTARTATADSDLIHVNSGGTDYKETKLNFLKASFGIEFSNTTNITTQADALPDTGTYYGTLISSGHQVETGTPAATFWYVRVLCLSSYYKVIDLWGVDDPQANHYVKCKKNNSWQSAWTLDPTRAEITSLNNSLANKQNDLGLTLVYYGSVPANNSYSMSGTANQAYFVVFGTWNFRKICFVDPANGNAPRVTNIGEASNLLSVTANGDWGLTFNNGTIYSMPLIVRRLN